MVKCAALGRQLRQQDAFEHEVADLALERAEVAAIERIEHLVGLFEHERPQAWRGSASGPTGSRRASGSVWTTSTRRSNQWAAS